MAYKYMCTACRRLSQPQSSRAAHSQTVTDRLTSSSSYRSFYTTRRHATPPAASETTVSQQKAAPTARKPLLPSASPTTTSRVQPMRPSTTKSLAKSIRETMPAATETYVAYGACEKLVQECSRQADYRIPQATVKGAETPKTKDGVELGVGEGWWYETLKLSPTFESWAQVTFLHMYLLTVRFRCFPPSHARPWHQHLIDHFSYLAEDKMAVDHKMVARSERNKYLKDLFVQWRGCQAGYDEGLVKGDAVLATAVWRNVFKGDVEVDWRQVGEVVSYLRHVLGMLGEMSDAEIAGGNLVFGGNPGSERVAVLVRAKGMDSKGEAVGGTVAGSAAQNRGVDTPAKGKLMPAGGK